MKALTLFLSAGFIASCSHYPTPLPNKDGGASYLTQVAGKGSVSYGADGSMMLVFDNEISWQYTMQTAAALGLSYMDMLVQLEEQLSQRFLQGQITKRQYNAGLAKLEEMRLAAGLKSEGIGAGAPLGPVNFE